MDRRSFLITTVLGFGALKALGARHLDGLITPIDYELAVIKGGDIARNVEAAVESVGGIGRFVKQGDIVLLKPNVSFPNPPEWGTTTHPVVIETVADLCAGAGAKRVIVADFPMSRARMCLQRSGMAELAASTRAFTFVELKSERHFETVPVPGGEEVQELRVARLLAKADVFINLPTAKAHSATGVSFGLKNLMGLFWERQPFHQKYDLHNAIVDLASIMRPRLTVLDATYGLLTNGPQGPGKVEQLNTIIAGIDPVAVDAEACLLAPWNGRTTDPDNIMHLAKAAERGLGTLNLSPDLVFRKEFG